MRDADTVFLGGGAYDHHGADVLHVPHERYRYLLPTKTKWNVIVDDVREKTRGKNVIGVSAGGHLATFCIDAVHVTVINPVVNNHPCLNRFGICDARPLPSGSLIVVSIWDRIVNSTNAETLYKMSPGTKIVRLETSAHCPTGWEGLLPWISQELLASLQEAEGRMQPSLRSL